MLSSRIQTPSMKNNTQKRKRVAAAKSNKGKQTGLTKWLSQSNTKFNSTNTSAPSGKDLPPLVNDADDFVKDATKKSSTTAQNAKSSRPRQNKSRSGSPVLINAECAVQLTCKAKGLTAEHSPETVIVDSSLTLSKKACATTPAMLGGSIDKPTPCVSAAYQSNLDRSDATINLVEAYPLDAKPSSKDLPCDVPHTAPCASFFEACKSRLPTVDSQPNFIEPPRDSSSESSASDCDDTAGSDVDYETVPGAQSRSRKSKVMSRGPSPPRKELDTYEMQRQRNIEANNKMLAELGLMGGSMKTKSAGLIKPTAKTKKPLKKRTKAEQSTPPPLDRRRSTRIRGVPAEQFAEGYIEAAIKEPISYSYDEPGDFFEIGQIVDCKTGPLKVAGSTPTCATAYRRFGGHNHMIYSMSCSASKRFLVAGGGEGKVSFFDLNANAKEYDVNDVQSCIGTVKLHSRWISRAKFVNVRADLDAILTTADDGRMLLSSVQFADVVDGVEPQCKPLAWIGKELHARGIYSFDYQNGLIATTSKDSTVGITKLSDTTMSVVRTYSELHQGVVKAVRWVPGSGEPTAFISAGDDCLMNLYDIRASAISTTVEPHQKRINSITFHPRDGNLFLTGSSDKTIKGHDLRNMSTPVFSLNSHHHPSVKSSSLTAPVFYTEGTEFLSIGDKTDNIYAYNVAKQLLDRQMYVGFTPSCLYNHGGKVLAAHGKTTLYVLDSV
ncbi:hypothetical protein SARC_08657 [Sphaeroforma arctica JP610]|uniref:Uncharacterized protein n=1 Tax=Sphaeroforma arctica JP610 TaxID=667725 RepID=A0A0L0FQW0_9EUKA|nr:hypothetical protein SARC_08657 [Sphaeroforma arctica JP610]KNC78936.1 hypothetical protein SARC_08657 [Sphaeroforma arctica JP610]|eukprot:XP_014152838.1 hypothetical protein SARC_08657 [Sphaeroforma arctica JP610]